MNGLAAAFGGVRRALEAAEVRYAIGGSWASTTHGEPRQTNDIDLIATFTADNLDPFLNALGDDYYVDRDTAHDALRRSRSFNVIHRHLAFKFDLFPANSPHTMAQVERSRAVLVLELDEAPVPIVSAEDIVIAKLEWYRAGGGISERQWCDILGVLRAEGDRLGSAYLDTWANRLGLQELYERARLEAEN